MVRVGKESQSLDVNIDGISEQLQETPKQPNEKVFSKVPDETQKSSVKSFQLESVTLSHHYRTASGARATRKGLILLHLPRTDNFQAAHFSPSKIPVLSWEESGYR